MKAVICYIFLEWVHAFNPWHVKCLYKRNKKVTFDSKLVKKFIFRLFLSSYSFVSFVFAIFQYNETDQCKSMKVVICSSLKKRKGVATIRETWSAFFTLTWTYIRFQACKEAAFSSPFLRPSLLLFLLNLCLLRFLLLKYSFVNVLIN